MRGGALRATVVLARRAHHVAVIDTGFSHHTGSLVAALKEFGVAPDDVNIVLNTHAHVDHSHNNSIFRCAQVYASLAEREWTRGFYYALMRCAAPEPEDVLESYPEMLAAIENAACSRKIVRKVLGIEKLTWDESRWDNGKKVIPIETAQPPDGITILPTPGHSPHHVSIIINTETRPALVAGDALLVRDEHARSELQIIPPYNSAQYRRSQQLIATFKGVVIPGHDEPFEQRFGIADSES